MFVLRVDRTSCSYLLTLLSHVRCITWVTVGGGYRPCEHEGAEVKRRHRGAPGGRRRRGRLAARRLARPACPAPAQHAAADGGDDPTPQTTSRCGQASVSSYPLYLHPWSLFTNLRWKSIQNSVFKFFCDILSVFSPQCPLTLHPNQELNYKTELKSGKNWPSYVSSGLSMSWLRAYPFGLVWYIYNII